MESRIPLPTDNIFKFYALFGLLLIIFGIGSLLYVNQTTNNLVFNSLVEYGDLKADPARSLSEETRLHVLERKLEIAKNNKTFFGVCIGLIIGAGGVSLVYGFRKWHTEVQPLQDEMYKLTIKKLKVELGIDDAT